ncbi:MAG: type II toxin-antitoxin system RelE/ParE family toxin [Candidatus Methanofastidiosia archaeon]
MIYELIFDKYFKKDLSKLDREMRNRILRKIFELEKYPELGKHLVGMDIWSLRIGKYRVLYKIKYKHLQVLVLTIEHRKKAYR